MLEEDEVAVIILGFVLGEDGGVIIAVIGAVVAFDWEGADYGKVGDRFLEFYAGYAKGYSEGFDRFWGRV